MRKWFQLWNLNRGQAIELQIEVSDHLWSRLVKSAEGRGYASPHKYVTEVIEREVAKLDSCWDAEIAQKNWVTRSTWITGVTSDGTEYLRCGDKVPGAAC